MSFTPRDSTRLPRGVYAITPTCPDVDTLMATMEPALAGGVRVVQFRQKAASPELRQEMAKALAVRCRAAGVVLIVNDNVALAQAVGAEGVHLGRHDGNIATARAMLGDHAIIGASCYNDGSLGAAALAAGASYLAFGSFYPSRTKPDAVAANPSLILQARVELGADVVAIGGITVENAAPLLAAGARNVAVISDLFDAPDVCARAREWQRLFENTPETPPSKP